MLSLYPVGLNIHLVPTRQFLSFFASTGQRYDTTACEGDASEAQDPVAVSYQVQLKHHSHIFQAKKTPSVKTPQVPKRAGLVVSLICGSAH
jgi:hypothetical protein